jgi:hypothetical protein
VLLQEEAWTKLTLFILDNSIQYVHICVRILEWHWASYTWRRWVWLSNNGCWYIQHTGCFWWNCKVIRWRVSGCCRVRTCKVVSWRCKAGWCKSFYRITRCWMVIICCEARSCRVMRYCRRRGSIRRFKVSRICNIRRCWLSSDHVSKRNQLQLLWKGLGPKHNSWR